MDRLSQSITHEGMVLEMTICFYNFWFISGTATEPASELAISISKAGTDVLFPDMVESRAVHVRQIVSKAQLNLTFAEMNDFTCLIQKCSSKVSSCVVWTIRKFRSFLSSAGSYTWSNKNLMQPMYQRTVINVSYT